MNTSSAVASFECPKGFTKENNESQLYLEDLDDDSELWLIRMPYDMDKSVLENKRIKLDGTSNVLELDGDTKKVYQCFSKNYEEPNLCLVLPHKNSSALSGVKKTFKGSLFVSERSRYCIDSIVKAEYVQENGMMDCATDALEVLTTEKKPKKSKKSSHSFETIEINDSDLNESADLSFLTNGFVKTEDNETFGPQDGSRHHKKRSKGSKKKSVQTSDIKKEPQSDLDDFPNCDSQK